MALVDPASLPNVLDAAIVSALGDRLADVANTVTTAFSDAHTRWGGLRGVFDVRGAEGVHLMLDRPLEGANEFAGALQQARNALWDAASLTLPDLKARREELAARITTVNADWDAAEQAYSAADSAYWSQWRADRDSSETTQARTERAAADGARTEAAGAGDALLDDIARFRADVESAEELIASQLTQISGGTEVLGAWGEPVRVAQTFWGFVDAPYPGAPASIAGTQSLAQHLADALSDSVAARIGWLGSADDDAVRAWMASHPDFASAVGFVDPERAARLWSDLAGESEPGAARNGVPADWIAGPLAQLFALAPLAIANLNGAPASQRDVFAREGLTQLLDDDALPDDARDKLTSIVRLLESDSDARLLSVFLDADGSPRASLAWGDVDTADQITTLSHGISTDLGGLTEWSSSALNLQGTLGAQLRDNGIAAGTATVLFMEWDSGDMFTVQAIDRPDAGAARFTQLLAGFAQTNPGAQRNVVLHSLGTTMGAQAIADNPGLVDNAWFFGSAGLSPEAGGALATQIADGTLAVHATHASADWVAPLGRTAAISQHPVDPRTLTGVQQFGADGGLVEGFGESGRQGEATEGHNAQESTEILYWGLDGWSTTPDGNPVPNFDSTSTGYLDPAAQSYLQLVVDLAEAARLVEVP